MRHKFSLCLLLLSAAFSKDINAQKSTRPQPSIRVEKGRILYQPDSLGNRVPDFSWCGYAASEKKIPIVAAKVVVPPVEGDATDRIQAALDYVAGLPADKEGFRGAVQLEAGTYRVLGSLQIKVSGIVLRGAGIDREKGTQLIAGGKDRRTLIQVRGVKDRQMKSETMISSSYVPVNATGFRVASAGNFKKGDKVIIKRPSTIEWINLLGTGHFGGGITALGWKPGDHDLFFDREIREIHGDSIVIDVPLTTALDTNLGGGTIAPYEWKGRIYNIGIENLRCISEYDTSNVKDEAHSWMGVTIENARDVWVRQVFFEHFAGSAVYILETGSRITVEDSKSLSPVSEIGGQRRNSFFTMGQQTLFQRCYAEHGYHDFATGYGATGPNAFVECESYRPFSFSGAIDSWASGVLFDRVRIDGNALRYGNRGQDGQGAGWCAANSLFWNCSAARIDCYRPPGAQNWAYGSWSQFAGDGEWQESNNTLDPPSFFYAQLTGRLQRNTDDQSFLLLINTSATSSPTVGQAAELTELAERPSLQLKEWIDQAVHRNPIPVTATGVKTVEQIASRISQSETEDNGAVQPLVKTQVRNGWLVRGDEVLAGKRMAVPWWSGGVQGKDLQQAKPAITRFVPGRTGRGLTDDLTELTDSLKAGNVIGIEQNYGLWYDRRRDDHERIRRMDGEVWPPFYELPFDRSGKDTAWDGLSKYDLTKYNDWYWKRLKEFADLSDKKGLLLIHKNYFQHNIIEAGAHYADFPWRTANNINHTGFPEPPAYAGDKRIFFARQFYDTTDLNRRALHRLYIRKCLDNFKDNSAVIQLTGEEFTGPLHFVEFWLNVIREWEQENVHSQLIGLSATRDVQDAILNDPAYASLVDVIDIRYWHYQADGTAYAPEGGLSLAPRQHARLLKPRKSSFEQVYRAVRQYRERNPGKAVLYSGDSYAEFGWAVFMAGGSLPVLPPLDVAGFLRQASDMNPADLPGLPQGCYALSSPGEGYIIYQSGNSPAKLDLTAYNGKYILYRINPRTGKLTGPPQKLKGGKLITLPVSEQTGSSICWVSRVRNGS